jgi:D-sedoheptulose 7-phosphate isomerase
MTDDDLRRQLDAAARTTADLVRDDRVLAALRGAANACVTTLRAGGKVLFAGNGGSAAEAQHFAAELVSRFAFDRDGLPSIALSTDTSILTAIGNDYGYERLFARQIQAHGRRGDVFVGLTTSGTSPNVLRGFDEARRRGLVTVGFTGNRGGPMAALCDHLIEVPSADTPRIQEGHLVLGHVLCGFIEQALFGEPG